MNPFNPHRYGPRIALAPRPPIVALTQTCAVLVVVHVVALDAPHGANVMLQTQTVPVGLN